MNLCQSHGECVYVAPDIFELGRRRRPALARGHRRVRGRARARGGRRVPDARDPRRGMIVVVGASLAGLRAAQAVRASGWEGELLLVGEEQHKPYTRPPLSKELLHGSQEPARFPCDDLDAEWRLGARATALDVAARTVWLDDEPVTYEQLVIATGTRARRWPGETPANAYVVRDLDDALALKASACDGAQRRDRRRRVHRLRGRGERAQARPGRHADRRRRAADDGARPGARGALRGAAPRARRRRCGSARRRATSRRWTPT